MSFSKSLTVDFLAYTSATSSLKPSMFCSNELYLDDNVFDVSIKFPSKSLTSFLIIASSDTRVFILDLFISIFAVFDCICSVNAFKSPSIETSIIVSTCVFKELNAASND